MKEKKIGFVIMPFRLELKEVYKYAIKPAVEECGFTCVRADECLEMGNIARTIIEYIYNADVVIADLTWPNPNVFYELGVTHAIGNKVIMITQEIKEVPFDVRSYRLIVYEQTIEGAVSLKEKLIREINNLDRWKTHPSNPVQDFRPSFSAPEPDRFREIERRLDSLEVQLRAEISAKIRQEAFANFETLLARIERMEKMIVSVESKQLLNLGTISKEEVSHFPKQIPLSILDAILKRRIVLFIGAGASVSAGMPTANELQKRVISLAGIEKGETFLDTMDLAETEVGRHELASVIIRMIHVNMDKPSKVHDLIARVGFDVIITTNFDILMEEAIRRNGHSCFPVVKPEELAYVDTSDVLLVKIHGSLDRPDSLMLTSADYRRFQDRKNLLVQTLTHYFVTRSILFVGYSLGDENLLNILQDIGEKLGSHKRPAYVVMPKHDKMILARMEKVWPVKIIEVSAEKFFETLQTATAHNSG